MKNRLWLVIILMVIWCGFSNSFTLPNLFLGFVFSLMISFVAIPEKIDFHIDLISLIKLAANMISQLFLSSIEVGWDILTPKSKSQAMMIHLPIDCRHPVQIALLANLISLTPGTLAVDIDDDDAKLVIHIMFAQREKGVVDFIKNTLEPLIIKVIRHG